MQPGPEAKSATIAGHPAQVLRRQGPLPPAVTDAMATGSARSRPPSQMQHEATAANSAGSDAAQYSAPLIKTSGQESTLQRPGSAASGAAEAVSEDMDTKTSRGPAAPPAANEQFEDGNAFLDQLTAFFQARGEQPPHLVRYSSAGWLLSICSSLCRHLPSQRRPTCLSQLSCMVLVQRL